MAAWEWGAGDEASGRLGGGSVAILEVDFYQRGAEMASDGLKWSEGAMALFHSLCLHAYTNLHVCTRMYLHMDT